MWVFKGVEPLDALARRHGVSANTPRKWRDDFLEAGKARLVVCDQRDRLPPGAAVAFWSCV